MSTKRDAFDRGGNSINMQYTNSYDHQPIISALVLRPARLLIRNAARDPNMCALRLINQCVHPSLCLIMHDYFLGGSRQAPPKNISNVQKPIAKNIYGIMGMRKSREPERAFLLRIETRESTLDQGDDSSFSHNYLDIHRQLTYLISWARHITRLYPVIL